MAPPDVQRFVAETGGQVITGARGASVAADLERADDALQLSIHCAFR